MKSDTQSLSTIDRRSRGLGLFMLVAMIFALVAAPATAGAASPSLSGTANYRYCTNTSLPGCAAAGSIARSTSVTMHCWIDDSTATGAYKSPRWFYVTAGTGVRGFVHSSFVVNQSSVPHCGQHRGISAARWAAMQVGETRPSTAEKGANSTMDRWSGWCYVLAWDAHKLSTGATPKSGYKTAKNTFYAYRDAGRVTTNLNANSINIGAIVFWTSGTYGHAAIYVGQGLVATTNGDGTSLAANSIRPMSYFGTPSGWVAPGNV